MKRLFLLLTLVIFTVINSNAEENNPATSKEFKLIDANNIFGVKYSSISGYGLYYERNIGAGYSFSLGGFAFYSQDIQWADNTKKKETMNQKNVNMDIGLEFRKKIYEENTYNIFVLGGGKFANIATNSYGRSEQKDIYTCGVGTGVSFTISRNLGAELSVGYSFELENGLYDASPTQSKQTSIAGGIGVFYAF